jgi:hypothetical protein
MSLAVGAWGSESGDTWVPVYGERHTLETLGRQKEARSTRCLNSSFSCGIVTVYPCFLQARVGWSGAKPGKPGPLLYSPAGPCFCSSSRFRVLGLWESSLSLCVAGTAVAPLLGLGGRAPMYPKYCSPSLFAHTHTHTHIHKPTHTHTHAHALSCLWAERGRAWP